MALIRFRVIRIKKYQFLFKSIAVAALAISTILLICSFGNNRVLPALSTVKGQELTGHGTWFLSSEVLKQVICWGLPYMDISHESRPISSLELNTFIQKLPAIATNIDINSPKSYFSFQIPVMGLAKIKSTLTPGIELPVNPILPIEDEHHSQEPLPAPPPSEEISVEKIQPGDGNPLVLIFHTHTSESFMPSPAYNYKPRDKAYHTEDLNFSVAKVGEILTQELLTMKVPTLHDKTIHDIPTYTTSYSNSLKTVEKIIKDNPTLQIVIDLHRDAPVVDSGKSREITTVKIDGVLYSRLMFVVGTDSTFEHPHWKENHQFAQLLNSLLEEQYPGISRGLDLRRERFNQHLSKKALLIEVGSHGNTMEESMASAKIFAKVLAEVIGELYAD